VKVTALSDETCTLELSGTARPKGDRKGSLKPIQSQLEAGVAETLKLNPSRKLKVALKEAEMG
jgi:hypothetical protein